MVSVDISMCGERVRGVLLVSRLRRTEIMALVKRVRLRKGFVSYLFSSMFS